MTDPRGIGHLGLSVPRATAIAVMTVGGQEAKDVVQFEHDVIERIDRERSVMMVEC